MIKNFTKFCNLYCMVLCVFTIKVVVNYEMYSVFMSYGSGIKIISPSNVVAYMRRIINKMSLLY